MAGPFDYPEQHEPSPWLRASSIAKWSDCPKYAHNYVDRPARHVAAVVGTLTHAILNGEPKVELPAEIHFDTRITPTIQDARQQARALAANIRKLYARERINITHREIEMEEDSIRLKGHVDAVAERDGQCVIIDIKTGRGTGQGWLQLGAYAVLLENHEGGHIQPDLCAIVHAPRAKPRNMKPATIQYRSAADLKQEFWQWFAWYDDLHVHGHQNVATPGQHCNWCPLRECPVRAG